MDFTSLQKHRAEIDARAGNFHSFETFGLQLLANRHYASPEIQDKLDTLKKEKKDLERWGRGGAGGGWGEEGEGGKGGRGRGLT